MGHVARVSLLSCSCDDAACTRCSAQRCLKLLAPRAHFLQHLPCAMPHRAFCARLAPVLRCATMRPALLPGVATSSHARATRPVCKHVRFYAGSASLPGRWPSPHIFARPLPAVPIGASSHRCAAPLCPSIPAPRAQFANRGLDSSPATSRCPAVRRGPTYCLPVAGSIAGCCRARGCDLVARRASLRFARVPPVLLLAAMPRAATPRRDVKR